MDHEGDPEYLSVGGDASLMSDAELMQGVAGGDRDAFAALIERHQQNVHHLAYRFVGRADVADDLAQDAWLRVYRAAGTYQATAAFTTWLYRLVLNLARDWAKSQARRSAAPLPESVAGENAAAVQAERRELIDAIQDAILSLPENQRQAVVLHRYSRLSHREIAQIMEKTESAVESYLVRAYASLRSLLAGRT